MTEPCHMDCHAWKCREQWQSSQQISEESWKWWQNRERISLKLRSNSLRIEKLKKDTENLDILLLLKSQPLHRVAPFSVPSRNPRLFSLYTTRDFWYNWQIWVGRTSASRSTSDIIGRCNLGLRCKSRISAIFLVEASERHLPFLQRILVVSHGFYTQDKSETQ